MGAKIDQHITRDDHAFHADEDREIRFDVVQSDDTTPQAMTGWTLSWILYDYEGGTALLTLTTTAGQINISDGAGTDDRATVIITDAATLTIAPSNNYYHRLRRTDDGNETVLAEGDFVLLPA